MSKEKLARRDAWNVPMQVINMIVGLVIAFPIIYAFFISFMEPAQVLTGGINFGGLFYALDGNEYASIEAAAEAGVGTLNYGMFIQNIVDFVLIAFCMFLVIKFMAKMKKPEPAPAPAKAPRLCPYCKQEIADDATRCHHCTSELK